jgi:hypothetical protein
MCVAAFGFIAGMLMFAHPALPVGGAPNATATEGAAVATAQTPTAMTLSRLAAPP